MLTVSATTSPPLDLAAGEAPQVAGEYADTIQFTGYRVLDDESVESVDMPFGNNTLRDTGYVFPEAAVGHNTYGLPGWIRQADILRGYGDKAGWRCTVEPAIARVFWDRAGVAAFDGVVGRITPAIAKAAAKAGVPAVNIWLNSPVKSLPAVFADWETAGAMAAEHLLGRGLRRFGYLGIKGFVNTRQQLQGFRSVLRREGFRCTAHRFPDGHAEWNSPHWKLFVEGLETWVDSLAPPVGILVGGDLYCRFLIDVCRRNGLNVPGDIAIVGTGNETILCGSPMPSLTSIDLGHVQIGHRAAALLDRMMDGGAPPAEPEFVLPSELVPRQSTDVFAVDDPLVARALRFIAENSNRMLGVPEVAAEVAVSRRKLERRFRDAVGRSIAEESIRLRINRAKRRLVESDEDIKMVAAASGFCSANHFGKVFTRMVGISPVLYRKARK